MKNQFRQSVRYIQPDNGKEFANNQLCTFFSHHGKIRFRLSCPNTSAQNGKYKRILRTLNQCMHILLLQASLPYRFWAEALYTATLLVDRESCKPKQLLTPYELLHGANLITPLPACLSIFAIWTQKPPQRTSLHHDLSRVIQGYLPDHNGFHCYDPHSRRVIDTHHVYFDEDRLPFSEQQQTRSGFGSPPSLPLVYDELSQLIVRAVRGSPGMLRHFSCACAGLANWSHAWLGHPSVQLVITCSITSCSHFAATPHADSSAF